MGVLVTDKSVSGIIDVLPQIVGSGESSGTSWYPYGTYPISNPVSHNVANVRFDIGPIPSGTLIAVHQTAFKESNNYPSANNSFIAYGWHEHFALRFYPTTAAAIAAADSPGGFTLDGSVYPEKLGHHAFFGGVYRLNSDITNIIISPSNSEDYEYLRSSTYDSTGFPCLIITKMMPATI